MIFRYCKSLMLIADWKMSANHVFYQLDQPIVYLLFDSLTWHLQWNDILFWLSLMMLILKRKNYKLKNKFLFIANKVEKTLKYLCFVVLSFFLTFMSLELNLCCFWNAFIWKKLQFNIYISNGRNVYTRSFCGFQCSLIG